MAIISDHNLFGIEGSTNPVSVAGSNLFAWYNSVYTYSDSLMQTQCVNGDQARWWKDLSGNGLHYPQATQANRGTFNANQINGQPAIKFNGTSNYYQISFGSTLSNPVIIIVGMVPTLLSGYGAIYDGITLGNRCNLDQYNTAGQGYLAGSTGGNVGGMFTAGSWFANNVLWNGSSTVWHVNGGTDSTGINTGTSAITGLTLGASYAPASYSNAYIAEVIVCKSTLTSGQRAALDAYVRSWSKIW
jgi:hypothetical protein